MAKESEVQPFANQEEASAYIDSLTGSELFNLLKAAQTELSKELTTLKNQLLKEPEGPRRDELKEEMRKLLHNLQIQQELIKKYQ